MDVVWKQDSVQQKPQKGVGHQEKGKEEESIHCRH